MTVRDFPWEPPQAGSEVEHLVGALDRLRTTFRWKVDALDAAGLRTRIGASSLTLGGLLKHLAFVEDFTFTVKLRGRSPGPPWETADWDAVPRWDFVSAADDPPSSSMRSGRKPSHGPGRGSTRRWPTAASTISSTSRPTTAATPACAGSCAT